MPVLLVEAGWIPGNLDRLRKLLTVSEFEQYLAGELDKAYALEMTRTALRSEAVATDPDVIEFAAILGIHRRYPVAQRWPHRWTCRRGIWAGW